ncbi:hypothetical protein H6P81_008054 [Aristolochia fimbriata]|uniref:Uncharacterized protein n=1 Tax=Aristolochia fimbriata TaxID=158543 RepID=A0AAV7F1Y2_ARIFI|nr:hypothetical protein H6P81_008054 [Aristolochia fimbriata]
MEEDSIDESESLVSPRNLQLRGAFRGEDNEGEGSAREEKETVSEEAKEVGGEKNEKIESNEVEDEKNGEEGNVRPNEGTERSERLIDHLLRSLPGSITGKSKDESATDDGLIDHLSHGLPASVTALTEDAAPASDEATLLISTIIHE